MCKTKKWLGVNALITKYRQDFNAKEVSKSISDSTDMDQRALMSAWDVKKNVARDTGDNVHRYIGEYIKNGGKAKMRQGYENHCKQFKEWYALNKEKHTFLYTEYRVKCEQSMIRGDIDQVTMTKVSNSRNDYVLIDWKTNENIIKTSDKMMKGPFGHLPDCHLTHLSLQLNIYDILFNRQRDEDENGEGVDDDGVSLLCVNFTNFNGWEEFEPLNLYKEARKMIMIREVEIEGQTNDNM